jgi:hypothetical protein
VTVPAVQPAYDLSQIGLRLRDPHLPISEFTDLCWTLGQAHMALRFAIGDAIVQGEALYGEEAFQAFEALQLSEDARQEYRRVSERVPMSRRRKGLSWSHHRAVAALEGPEQKEWLRRAEQEGLSHHALREELRNGAEPKVYSKCRCCGRPLGEGQ